MIKEAGTHEAVVGNDNETPKARQDESLYGT